MLNLTYLAVKGISEKFKEQLKTVARNKGITLSGMLRPILRKFYESQPENLKTKRDLD